MQEKVVEIKDCKQCGNKFEINEREVEFYKKVSPKFNDELFEIPTPTLCPECRQQRRLSWRNERSLYKRKCDKTGKEMISIYSPDKDYIVYNRDFWRSDKWEALDYGMDFDFEKSFFEQYEELLKKVPKYNIEISPSENCEYTNQAGYNKNCYLVFEAGYTEDCFYSSMIRYSNNTYDCLQVDNLDNCYECVDSNDLYNVSYAFKTNNCKNSLYLYDCKNCENCIGCWNLLGKKYYILNKEVSKEEYNIFKEKFDNDLTFKKNFLIDFEKEKNKSIIYKNLNNLSCENVVGDNILESNNCSGYSLRGSKNCYNSTSIYNSQDCYDYDYWGNDANFVLNSISVGNGAYKMYFSNACYDNVGNIFYSSYCINNCSNLFGCVGLQNKSYCVFNKQYTKEEYEKLVSKIISHMQCAHEWGEFFPSKISLFGYNETVANEYFPLKKEDILSPPVHLNFKWSDYNAPLPKVTKLIPANKLPEYIKNIPDDILNWAIECEVTKKPFRILSQELEFYRKHNISIPKIHPDQRHLDRMAQRNPRKLIERKCDKCEKDMQSTYSSNREEKIYCEECYEKEVY